MTRTCAESGEHGRALNRLADAFGRNFRRDELVAGLCNDAAANRHLFARAA